MELCQGVLGSKTVWRELGGPLQVINCWIDIAGESIGEAQEHMSLAEIGCTLNALCERGQRGLGITCLEPCYPVPKALDRFRRQLQASRSLASKKLAGQL